MSFIKANYIKHTLIFKQPSGTSRGVLNKKDSWFVILSTVDNPDRFGIGECSLINGLSIDSVPEFESVLDKCCRDLSRSGKISENELTGFPAIRFGFETAFLDLHAQKERILFPSEFTNGEEQIPINGLIWMGEVEFMKQQIENKLIQGYTCLKLKIGAIDFHRELELLQSIRTSFSSSDLELRVDANGAFSASNAMQKLNELAAYDLHSIEQPIRQGQREQMAELCSKSPVPIALDEELIGIVDPESKGDLLETIHPQYIILKPSLLGGLKETEKWVSEAERRNIDWWVTSALESNIGLNAIAQWTFTLNTKMRQGLGTGQLYTNNIPSPLTIENGFLAYNPDVNWQLEVLFEH